MSDHKPIIGTMAVGLASYWPQFHGMKDTILSAHAKVNAMFEGRGRLVEAGLVDNATAAREAGRCFAEAGVDILFVHLATYANSETLLPAVRDLNVPVVLLNVQPARKLNMDKVTGIGDWLGMGVTPASLPEMTNVLIRLGKRFDSITGHLEGDEQLRREIELWCKLAGLRRRLRTQSMALLGRPFAGMMDLNIDETQLFSRLGIFVHNLDWNNVVAEIEAADDSERRIAVEDLRRTFLASGTLTEVEIAEAGRVLAGMRRFVKRYNLCAIASHYEGKASGSHAEVLAALNPALSVLNGDGYACPVEADMKVAVAMLTLKTIGGSATLAELYSMDFDDDILIIGHSGAGDPAISRAAPRLAMSEVFHGKPGKGYLTQFFPGAGQITLLSMMQDQKGDYRFIVAEGEIVEGPTLQLGDTNARVRFRQGLRQFIRDWSAEGPTHHGVMGYGHHAEALGRAAIALDLPITIVST